MYRKRYVLTTLLLLSFALLWGQNHEVKPGKYRIQPGMNIDSGMYKWLLPYQKNLEATMNKPIGFSAQGMSKKPLESVLGNFMADAMMQMSTEKFGRKPDAAFVNYGGIRSYIPKGEVLIRHVFELMPFDNLIVLQEVTGDSVQSFLNKIAERGGWPVSGIQFQIKNKQAVNIYIGGQQLDLTKTYVLANSDYVANGGDDCFMLKAFKQINKGYLFRDALIEYIQHLTKEGQTIDAKTENRISYAP